MKREYPDILNCKKEPHEVQFLPDCYLYGELTLKVCSIFLCERHNGATQSGVCVPVALHEELTGVCIKKLKEAHLGRIFDLGVHEVYLVVHRGVQFRFGGTQVTKR